MKKSVLTFLLLLIATTTMAQIAQDDKTRLLGKWRIHEIVKDGELTMSCDPKKHQQLIDEAWAKDSSMLLQMGLEKAGLAASMEEQSKSLSEITFDFSENGKVNVSANDDKSKDVFSSYSINEEKHEIIIEEESNDKLIYQYLFVDDLLVLKREENDRLIFKRMKL